MGRMWLVGCQEVGLYSGEWDENNLGRELGLSTCIHEIQAWMDDSEEQKKNDEDDSVKEMFEAKMPSLPQAPIATWDE